MGQRDISGSSQPRQNSSAVAAASIAIIPETTTTRRLTSSANAGMRQASSQRIGAKTTTSGNTLRPSNLRAPAQVRPYASSTSALAMSIEMKSGIEPRDVTSARPVAPTICAAPHHNGARIVRFCMPANTSNAPSSAVTNTVTTERVPTSRCMQTARRPSVAHSSPRTVPQGLPAVTDGD